MPHEYRDRIYIRKDIILKLAEHGEMTQTKLLAYCGLNLVRHRDILNDLEKKGFLTKFEVMWGTKTITKYKVTQKGREFCQMILDPYEEMFPRKGKEDE